MLINVLYMYIYIYKFLGNVSSKRHKYAIYKELQGGNDFIFYVQHFVFFRA